MKTKYWKTHLSWPFPPPGYTFLPAAFDAVGRAVFPGRWTGEEGCYEGHGERIPSPHVVFDGDTDQPANHEMVQKFRKQVTELLDRPDQSARPTWQQWCDACDKWQYYETYGHRLKERRDIVLELIHDAAARGDIVFTTRSAGCLTDLEARLWNCDRHIVRARFEWCAIHTEQPFEVPQLAALYVKNPEDWARASSCDASTTHIFIETKHLEDAAQLIGSNFRKKQGNKAGPEAAQTAARPSKKRGRPAKYDWNALIGELIRIADEDGLDEHFHAQADVERWSASWFHDQSGDHPAESLIREKIAPIYQARDKHNARKAGNLKD